MKENRIYSCPNCKSIMVIPKTCWLKVMKCTACDTELKLLDDEFELSEIIGEKEDDNDDKIQ